MKDIFGDFLHALRTFKFQDLKYPIHISASAPLHSTSQSARVISQYNLTVAGRYNQYCRLYSSWHSFLHKWIPKYCWQIDSDSSGPESSHRSHQFETGAGDFYARNCASRNWTSRFWPGNICSRMNSCSFHFFIFNFQTSVLLWAELCALSPKIYSWSSNP